MNESPQSHWEWLAGGIAGLIGLVAMVRRSLGFEWPKERIEARNEYREKVDRMQEDISKIAQAIAPIGPALDKLASVIDRMDERNVKKIDNLVDSIQRLAGRVGDLGAQGEGLKAKVG